MAPARTPKAHLDPKSMDRQAPEGMRVYHLVGREHGLQNIRHRRLKIAEIEDLNDPFELRSLSSPDRDVRRAFDLTRAQLAANRGVLCFSANWHNPVLWSHYADRHRGRALGFDVADDSLAKVSYRRYRLPFDPGAMSGDPAQAEEQMLSLLTTKYSHWRYENEWRAFLSLEDREAATNLCFAQFSQRMRLREVVVGARSTISRAELTEALGSLAPEVSTLKVRLAFRSFRVVRQRMESLWA